MRLNIKVLGCDGGISPDRKTTCFLINDKILLDAGSAASSLSIETQKHIDHILLTHIHLDHVKDLCFLVENSYGREKPIQIISQKEILSGIRRHLFNDIVWPDFSKLPNKINPTIRYKPIKNNFKIGNFKITAIPVNHTIHTCGYLVDAGRASILFSADTGPTEDIWKLANRTKNLKAIVMEISFPNEMENVAILSKHLTPKLFKEEIKKIKNKDITIYINHIKPAYYHQVIEEVIALKIPQVKILGQQEELEI